MLCGEKMKLREQLPERSTSHDIGDHNAVATRYKFIGVFGLSVAQAIFNSEHFPFGARTLQLHYEQ